jgi:transcriptional regulator with XRE-family HTH domain
MTINSEETINPKALRAARKKQGLSQQTLADAISRQPGRNISAKAIYRYENEKGESKPSRKRAQWLADALRTTVEKLCKDPEDDAGETSLRNQGYIQIRPWLRPDVVRNCRLVGHHYGVSVTDLVEAAPWMFTLLAEMSLADRKQRLADAEVAFEEAMARLPSHLGHGELGRWNFDNAFEDEKTSIGKRDIFGKEVLKTDSSVDPFDPAETNPFVDFLRRTASKIGSDEIDDDACEIWLSSDLPEWPVFAAWLDEVTGEDGLALHAIEKGHVKLGTIPPELLGAEKRTERVAWLVDQIPADERERLIELRDAPVEGL